MSHFIEKCKHCGKVIRQCRCPDPAKITTYAVCERCKKLRPGAKTDGGNDD